MEKHPSSPQTKNAPSSATRPLTGADQIKRENLTDEANFNPAQTRDDHGRWSGDGSESPQPINSRRRSGSVRDRQLEGRLADLTNRAQNAIDRVRELDPKWEPPPSFLPRDNNIEPRIQHQEMMLRAAEARYAEITRDAIPGTNPSWGVNRLTKELYDQGYRLEKPTRDPGLMYRNPTGEEVRIMERPIGDPRRSDPPEKHYFEYYYRYRSGDDQAWGRHFRIPDKQ